MVMAPNGTMITAENAAKMRESGIKRISISLDGSTRESHDKFRGVIGAFDGALNGIKFAKEAGIEFQINTTITKTNLDQIPKILSLAESLGAVAHHIFLQGLFVGVFHRLLYRCGHPRVAAVAAVHL